MQLDKAKGLVAYIFADPLIHGMAQKGDKLSSHQTDHGMKHFMEVVKYARQITAMLSAQFPGLISPWDAEVTIPLAALLHDIGRAESVDDHAKAGAKFARDYLSTVTLPGDNETLPIETVKHCARIVACHRSGTVLKVGYKDVCHVVVVTADKVAGDEDRVRPVRASIISLLTLFRLSFIPLRKGGTHDRANFAIKDVSLEITQKDIHVNYVIDPRVCDSRLIVELYADRYLACHLGAEFLGLKFKLNVRSVHEFGPVGKLRARLGLQKAPRLDSYSYCAASKRWVNNPLALEA